MLNIPAFASHITVTLVANDAVVIIGSGQQRRIESRYWGAVYPRITGAASVDDIVSACLAEQPDWNATDLYTFLFQLEKRGIVVEHRDSITDVNALSLAVTPKEQQASVGVHLPAIRLRAVGNPAFGELRSTLSSAGILVVPETDTSDAIDVYVADDYLQPVLADINKKHLASGTPWILIQTNGLEHMVGPWFQPTTGPCWECLASRYRMNRDVKQYLKTVDPNGYPFPEKLRVPGSVALIAGMLIEQLALKATRSVCSIDSAVLTWDVLPATVVHHHVMRRPQCSACGHVSEVHTPEPLTLASSPRKQSSDAGYRSMTSEQVYERYKHLVSHVSGVVTSLERITDPADPIQHVYVSGQNFATSMGSLSQLRRSLRSNSCGKGTTDIQAKVSGLCEAIERYSGVFRGDEHRVLTSLTALGDRGIHQNSILQISDEQYANRAWWNGRDHKFSLVCEPFDTERTFEWSPVWSLTEERTKWLPTGHLYYSYPSEDSVFRFMPDSNGASTGASKEEAILQGFLELVERDAFGIWWYTMTKQPRVDLSTFDDPYVRAMERRVAEMGRELWVIDITTDLGIPVFVAFSRDPAGPRENIVFAPGAHFDPTIALLRALTELNQMFPGIAPGQNGQEYAFDDPHSVDWWKTATIANQPYILPHEALPATRRENITIPKTTDLLEDIAIARSLVESRGMEFLVHDQTRPDIGMPVIKVIVPGLRHFWTRFAPGRLYDVPVQLGRCSVPVDEKSLNPIAVFI